MEEGGREKGGDAAECMWRPACAGAAAVGEWL